MSSIGMALVAKCVASNSQRRDKAVLAVYAAAKDVLPPSIANKTEHFSFKSGCVVQVENNEMCRQLRIAKEN